MRIYPFLRLWVKLFFLLSVSVVHANQMVASFSLGPGWYQAGQTQNLLLQENFSNTYVANRTTREVLTGELFLGVLKQFNPHLITELGVAGRIASPAHLSGVIWETGDSALDNFNYTYHINHEDLTVKGKVLTLINSSWYPYISANLGVAFNSSNHYASTPLLFEIVSTPSFTDHSNTSFTYVVGAGIQKAISTHWQLGIGYEFTDWGKSQLGPISSTQTNQALVLNHLYVNQLMLNITFLS